MDEHTISFETRDGESGTIRAVTTDALGRSEATADALGDATPKLGGSSTTCYISGPIDVTVDRIALVRSEPIDSDRSRCSLHFLIKQQYYPAEDRYDYREIATSYPPHTDEADLEDWLTTHLPDDTYEILDNIGELPTYGSL